MICMVAATLFAGGCAAQVGPDGEAKGWLDPDSSDLSGVWEAHASAGYCQAFIRKTESEHSFSLELNCMRKANGEVLPSDGWSARSDLQINRVRSSSPNVADQWIRDHFNIHQNGTKRFSAQFFTTGFGNYNYLQMTGLDLTWATSLDFYRLNGDEPLQAAAQLLLAGAGHAGKHYRFNAKEVGPEGDRRMLEECTMTVRRSAFGVSRVDIISDCEQFPGDVEGAIADHNGGGDTTYRGFPISGTDTVVKLNTITVQDGGPMKWKQTARLIYTGANGQTYNRVARAQ